MHHLPDELIAEILEPALRVSDRDFASIAPVSPFSAYAESPSAFLLVSKTWLRVATPLLYSVVIVRSKSQAAALARALSNKELNLGRFVKKLRVEGAYGMPLYTVLRNTPNIAHIFMFLDHIFASDPVDGLCNGLPLINPARLILRHQGKRNRSIAKVMAALEGCIPSWTNLNVLDISAYVYRAPGYPMAVEQLFKALSAARQLHTIVLNRPALVDFVYGALKDCPLKSIVLVHSNARLTANGGIATDKAARLVEYQSAQSVVAEPALVPRSNAPMVPANRAVSDSVFERILHFALYVPELEFDPAFKAPSRLPFLLVSKRFHKLGLGLYYACTTLKRSSDFWAFSQILTKHAHLGAEVRSLAIYWRPQYSKSDTQLERFYNNMNLILPELSALVRITCMSTPLPLAMFAALARRCGATLEEVTVHVEKKESVNAVDLFAPLRRCRKLVWSSEMSFNVGFDGRTLSNLEELVIQEMHHSFAGAIACIGLPHLSRLIIRGDPNNTKYTPLLQLHGTKLRELTIPLIDLIALPFNIFSRCPNLETLSISWPMSAADKSRCLPTLYLTPPRTYRSLVTLNMDVQMNHLPGKSNPKTLEWTDFFTLFPFQLFPGLKEIQMASCAWPVKEHDIKLSAWVRWSDAVARKGVQLTDRKGKGWKQRL
ncbi:Isocitrate dehydrogenase [Mycena kentingensis (nom. inval.)]|nr:Isocitrate dehydrogenase [Mycena kentingensis (nom. inval.)]